jgi:hypothetical protein
MQSFLSFVEQTDVNVLNTLPRFVRDCAITTHQINGFKESKTVQLPLFARTNANGGEYTYEEIVQGIAWLKYREFSSFIFVENSTYTLSLLERILNATSSDISQYSCSCSKSYNKTFTDKWGSMHVIHGLVIKITEKPVKGKSLPGDAIL